MPKVLAFVHNAESDARLIVSTPKSPSDEMSPEATGIIII